MASDQVVKLEGDLIGHVQIRDGFGFVRNKNTLNNKQISYNIIILNINLPLSLKMPLSSPPRPNACTYQLGQKTNSHLPRQLVAYLVYLRPIHHQAIGHEC